MSDFTNEFATMDKGYTPNRKELNLKKAYQGVIINNYQHPNAEIPSISINTEDINSNYNEPRKKKA